MSASPACPLEAVVIIHHDTSHDHKSLPQSPHLDFDDSRNCPRESLTKTPSICYDETFPNQHFCSSEVEARPSSAPDTDSIALSTTEEVGTDTSKTLEEDSTPAQCSKTGRWERIFRNWLLEIVSLCVSATCMAIIVVVLLCYRNKGIPYWPIGLTLNAIISGLSKVAIAALLMPVSEAIGQLKWGWFKKGSKKLWHFDVFDRASRGSWGSLQLLLLTEGRTLAALGATITVLALATDQFFEQIITYPEHWVLQRGDTFGTIARATGYRPDDLGSQYRLFDGGSPQLVVETDTYLQAVANSFFYSNGSTSTSFDKGARAELPVFCPSNNCTWPPFETLAICSECTDVSTLLTFACINTTLDWVQIPESEPSTNETTFSNGTSCGWWIKADTDAPLLMTGYNVDNGTAHSGEVLLMRAEPLFDINSRVPLEGYSPRLGSIRNPISQVLIASGESATSIHQNKTPVAHECIISWCINEMMSSYSEGGYSENIRRSSHNSTPGPDPWKRRMIYDEDGQVDAIEYDYNENIVLTSPNMGITYHIDNVTQLNLITIFDDVFPSTYTLINSTNDTDAMLRFQKYYTVNPYIRSVSYLPWLFPNVSTHLHHLTTAMTNLIRSSADGTELVKGPVFDMESFVDVRFEWLSFPFTLLILCFLFLASTIYRSSKQDDIEILKKSAVAALLYGLPDDVQKEIIAMKEDKTALERAEQTRMRWSRAGWRFSRRMDTAQVQAP